MAKREGFDTVSHPPIATLLVLTLLALAGFACGGRPEPGGAGEGSLVQGAFTNEHGTRDYRLYIPKSRGGERVPLIVMLHGCGQDAEDFAAGTRMNTLAERETFLVLYPEQDASANRLRCWNWFEPDHQERGRGEPSIIAGATEEVIAEHDVDPDRVYVAGISAGGSMSSILGATYPDLYAAIGIHSGLQYKAAGDASEALVVQQTGGPDPDRQGRLAYLSAREEARIVPAIVFHGEDDRVVDVVNGHQALAQWAQTNDLAHDGTDNDSISDEPADVLREREPDGYDYVRELHEDPEGEGIMEKWIVEELGHDWSGGDPEGSYTDPEGPDASAELVRFFGEHPKE